MSFGFSVSDFIAIGRLLMKLTQDYSSAPTEGRELANDLKLLQDCIDNLGSLSPHFGPEDNARLAARLAPIRELLDEMEKLRERYSSLMDTEGRPRVWDRLRFPKLQIQAIHKKINLHMSTLNLFMGTRSTTSLANIEGYLKDMAKNNPGGQKVGNDEEWGTMLPELQRRGMALDSAERCRTYIEEHLVALSEVEVAESQLLENFESSIVPDDSLDQDIIVGGPTPEHTFSCLCPGAILLQKGDLSGIKESKGMLYRHFGGHKYEISCKYCKFHGFQDDPLKVGKGEINTPLLYCARKEALSKDCTEYYLPAHKRNRGIPDGLFYHTLFFWKSHTPAKTPTKHDMALYECVFCPAEAAYGCLMNRKTIIDHIRRRHVQKLPEKSLRERFNVYVDPNTALFGDDEGRCAGRKFDILLPRALGRTDIIRAEQAMRDAEEKRLAAEKLEAENRALAEEKREAEAQRLAERRAQESLAQLQIQKTIAPLFPNAPQRGSLNTALNRQTYRYLGSSSSTQPQQASLEINGLRLLHEPPDRPLSSAKGILKPGQKIVRFQDEKRITEIAEEPAEKIEQAKIEGLMEEPLLNLVRTKYTPLPKIEAKESTRPKPKIVEVVRGQGTVTQNGVPFIAYRPDGTQLWVWERDEGMSGAKSMEASVVDSAVDVSMPQF